MDILAGLRDIAVVFVTNLPEPFTFFIVRMAVLLIITTGFITISWNWLPRPTVFAQLLVAFLGMVLVLNIRIEDLRRLGDGPFTVFVLMGLLTMFFLPGWIPAWLVPRYGDQIRLRRVLYWIVWGLFALQLIIGGS